MKFSFAAFSATVLAVVMSGVVSSIERTLTSRRVTMGFLNHAGMWGDLIIMSIVAGLVLPYIVVNRVCIFSSLSIGIMATLIAHFLWAKWNRADNITGHMFPSHDTGRWYLDISAAGWMHFIVMAWLLSLMLMYVTSPMPTRGIVTVSILVTTHVVLATVQPGWYCTGRLWTWGNLGPPLFVAVLVWGVAIWKIQFGKHSL